LGFLLEVECELGLLCLGDPGQSELIAVGAETVIVVAQGEVKELDLPGAAGSGSLASGPAYLLDALLAGVDVAGKLRGTGVPVELLPVARVVGWEVREGHGFLLERGDAGSLASHVVPLADLAPGGLA
jgi:hypothetical protein